MSIHDFTMYLLHTFWYVWALGVFGVLLVMYDILKWLIRTLWAAAQTMKSVLDIFKMKYEEHVYPKSKTSLKVYDKLPEL